MRGRNRVMWTREGNNGNVHPFTSQLTSSSQRMTTNCERKCSSTSEITLVVQGSMRRQPRIRRVASLPLPLSLHCYTRVQLARSLVNAARQQLYRNHANDKIFALRGNFASSAMAHDREARQFQCAYRV